MIRIEKIIIISFFIFFACAYITIFSSPKILKDGKILKLHALKNSQIGETLTIPKIASSLINEKKHEANINYPLITIVIKNIRKMTGPTDLDILELNIEKKSIIIFENLNLFLATKKLAYGEKYEIKGIMTRSDIPLNNIRKLGILVTFHKIL